MRAPWLMLLLLLLLVLSILVSAWLWLPSLRETYLELVRREADEAWLRTQCQNDAQFRTHMARLCAEAAATPLAAKNTWRRTLLKLVTTWPASTVGATIALVLSVVTVPGLYLTYRERIEHKRVLQACSPQLLVCPQLRFRPSSRYASLAARLPASADTELI